MLVISSFTFLAALHIALCSYSPIQTPKLTDCSGGQKTNGVNVLSVTVRDAAAGQRVTIEALAQVTASVGENAQLQLSFAKPNGAQLACVEDILPCTFNLCGGATAMEQEFGKEWYNKCPVPPGTYTGNIAFYVPRGLPTKLYFGDGNVVVTAKIVDGNLLYACETFPVKFYVY